MYNKSNGIWLLLVRTACLTTGLKRLKFKFETITS